MPLPRLQNWFLWAAIGLAIVLILAGTWEFWLSGAVHEWICGTLILLLALAARRMWSRPATPS